MKRLILSFIIASTSMLSYAADGFSQARPSVAQAMKVHGASLLASLSPKQRATAQFTMNSKEMSEWRYFPSPRSYSGFVFPEHHGLSIAQLETVQKSRMEEMLNLSLSSAGLEAVNAALELEKNDTIKFRGLINWLLFKYSPENYFISFFGTPSDSVWAWRFEGHHISLTFTINSHTGQVTASPVFIGTTQAEVVVDSAEGKNKIRVLEPVVLSAKALAQSLDADQMKQAKQSISKVPKANLYAPGLTGGKLKLSQPLPAGLSITKMSEAQRDLVLKLITRYQEVLSPEIASTTLEQLANSNLNNIEFVWTGDTQMKNPFYFRVQGETFVLELTCSEGKADHYHSVWINL